MVIALAPNFINLYGLVIATAPALLVPNPINLYGSVIAMAPIRIKLKKAW